MYIKQAFNFKHDWWLYVAGVAIIFIAVLLGQIPYTVILIAKAVESGLDLQNLDMNQTMTLLESNLNLFLMLLSFAAGLLGIFFVVKVLHNQSIKTLTTSRPKIDWRRFWFAFLFWGIISSGMVLIDHYLSPENYVFNFKLVPFLILAAIAIVLVPLQTSFEEYFFRGYLMQGLAVISNNKSFPLLIVFTALLSVIYFLLDRFIDLYLVEYIYNFLLKIIIFLFVSAMLFYYIFYTKVFSRIINYSFYSLIYKLFSTKLTPLIITSFTFGLLHIANPEIEKLGYILLVHYIGTGFFLGIITLMDDGLELALGFHAANNLFTALLVTADWTAFQTNSILLDVSDPDIGNFEIFASVLIVYPILILIFAKVYKWSNWKEKLTGSVTNEPVPTTNVSE